MCDIYSWVEKNGKSYYFNTKQRLEILKNCGQIMLNAGTQRNLTNMSSDSHTSICAYYNIDEDDPETIESENSAGIIDRGKLKKVFVLTRPSTWSTDFRNILLDKLYNYDFSEYIQSVLKTSTQKEVWSMVEQCLKSKSALIQACWKLLAKILRKQYPVPKIILLKEPLDYITSSTRTEGLLSFICQEYTDGEPMPFGYLEVEYCQNAIFPLTLSTVLDKIIQTQVAPYKHTINTILQNIILLYENSLYRLMLSWGLCGSIAHSKEWTSKPRQQAENKALLDRTTEFISIIVGHCKFPSLSNRKTRQALKNTKDLCKILSKHVKQQSI